MKKILVGILSLFLITSYSCKKEEEPVYQTLEYTVKGRITPTQGDSNFYWPNVWCSFFISYDDYLSPPQSETGRFRADSLGFIELKYSVSEERSVNYIVLRVHSDSLFTGFNSYCRIEPKCNIDTTYFFVDDTERTHGECE